MSDVNAKTSPALEVEEAARKPFGRAFWMLNSIEMFERLAYFGIRSVVPIYIMQATEPGGLHLTAVHKGWIYMWWAILQSWLPMFTGGIADRYGYKRVLVGAISANVVGYLMMAAFHSYHGFFAGILVLATGTAFFKPALQGSIAQNLTKVNSSVGWGIFYWVVNVGAVMAPVFATIILGKPHSGDGWRNLFIASAAYTACNLLLLFTFTDVPSGADKTESLKRVFARTIENIWPFWFRGGKTHALRGPLGITLSVIGLVVFIIAEQLSTWLGDPKLEALSMSGEAVITACGISMLLLGGFIATWLDGGRFEWQLRLPAFLAIMSCFWLMMYQLWDLHPNFITDWVDSSEAAESLKGSLGIWWEYGDRGLLQVPQQILLNLNAFLIVLIVIPISKAAAKMRTLSAMLVGMSVATAGIVVAGLTQSGWILLLGIVFFSLGEMWTGPKKNEYLGLIAPPGKKGLYLGYVNIPVGVGVGFGSMIAGLVYDNYGEKATLALKELAANPALVGRAAQAADWSDGLDAVAERLDINRSDAFELAQTHLGSDAGAAAETLRRYYRSDHGQIVNLAYLYLIEREPELELKARMALLKDIASRAQDLEAAAHKAAHPKKAEEGGDSGDGSSAAEDPVRQAAREADAAAALRRAAVTSAADLRQVAARIESGDSSIEALHLPRYVTKLPGWTEKKRSEVIDLLRDKINDGRADDEKLDDEAIIDDLWQRYGDDEQVVNNLALEYLAQATPMLGEAVAKDVADALADADGAFEDPVKQITELTGIDRTRSFRSLSAARGASDSEIDEALAKVSVAGGGMEERMFAYLAGLPHVRFQAVARRDWSRDVPLLEDMIANDAAAKAVAEQRIDDASFYDSTIGAFVGMFQDKKEQTFYQRLAEKPDLIQSALAEKDWTKSPEQARRLLRMSVPEARTQMALEIGNAPLSTTQLLWDKYHPQYKVWLPFAAIGVIAAIALAIFGQMAKRWADMNA